MKQKSLFYRIYFTVIAVFLIVLAIGLFVLHSWINDFDKSQPDYTANKILTEYLSKGNLYSLKEDFGLKLSDYESEKAVNASFKELTNTKELTLSSGAKTLNSEERTFYVKSADQVILVIKMQKNEKKNSFGNRGYNIKSVELPSELYKTVTVYAPSDAEITVNGIAVSSDVRKAAKLPEVLKKLPGNNKFVTQQTCTFDSFFSNSCEVSATQDGKKLEVTENEGTYTVALGLDADAVKKAEDLALTAAKEYAAYMQDDSYLGKVTKYLEQNTEFYEYVRTTPVSFAWDHDSYRFDNVSVSETHQYDSKTFRCRVKFTQVLVLGTTEYKDAFDQYVYMRDSGNGFKVIDMQTAGAEQ